MSANPKKIPAAGNHAPPFAKIRVGLVTASIWEKMNDRGTFFDVTFERRYKDGEEWKTSHSYNPHDLLELATAAEMAHAKIIERQNSEDDSD
jgi:hypothetical protein